jgi:hypothetical protein
MTRDIIQVSGPAITLVGIFLSIWGTFLLTRWYHTFDLPDFLKCGVQVTIFVITGQSQRAFDLIRAVTKFGRLNKERRPRSLAGLFMIFAGFVLQALGAVFWGVDMVWGILEKTS